jgi:magnesium chelatase subunit I
VFRRRVPADAVAGLVAAFDDGRVVHTGDELPSPDYVELVASVPALRTAVTALAGSVDSPAAVASAVEFLLEGLHLSKRLNKDVAADGRAVYRSRR